VFLLVLVFSTLNVFAYENLSAKEFYDKLKEEKDYVLLDVRTPQEFYEDGHIKDANLIPVQLFKYIYLGGKGIKDKKVFVYCRSGNRSSIAAKILEKWGVKKVFNLKDGILGWKKAGLPLEK